MEPVIEVAPKYQQKARAYGVSLSSEVNMTNCYEHCKHFFERCKTVHFNVLIAYWMMAGILGPVNSVEEAYQKGYAILLDLAYQEGRVLKPSDEDGSMIEFVAPADSEPIPCCRHGGFCFTRDLGFVDFLDDLGELWRVACTDGMLKTVPPNTEELPDHTTRQGSVLVIHGDHLSRQVFHLPRKLRYVAYFKPRPDSLSPLLREVTGLLSVLLLRDCELLLEIDFPLEKFRNLTVLEISGLSHVTTTIPLLHKISGLAQLQCLNLSDLLFEELPNDFFSKLVGLQCVILRGCSKLLSLPSIRPLKRLKMLDLSHCSALRKIATVVIQNPVLQMLDLSYTALIDIPIMKHNPKFTHLFLRNVKVSAHVLRALRLVRSLEVLDLSGAAIERVSEIEQLARDTNLTALDLSKTKIRSIKFLSDWIHLRELKLRECARLTKLPPVFKLTELQVLDISGCKSLICLPQGLSNLRSLQELILSGCSRLGELRVGLFDQLSCLANLRKLEVLDISSCLYITHLPEDLKHLTSLKKLNLSACSHLRCLGGDLFDHMSCLEELDLSNTKVTHLPSFANLANLRKLSLGGLKHTSLEELMGLKSLTKLEVLDISGCLYLTDLPRGLLDLRSLKELNLSGCRRLKGLWGLFDQMSGLEKLDLSKTNVKHLPSFVNLTNLRTLNLSNTKVNHVPSFVNLFKLSLGGLELYSLECLASLSSLVELDLQGVQIISSEKLKLDFFNSLVNLQFLNLWQTSFAKLVNLEDLLLTSYERLEAVLDLETLHHFVPDDYEAQSPQSPSAPTSFRELLLANCSGVLKLLPMYSIDELEFTQLCGTAVIYSDRVHLSRMEISKSNKFSHDFASGKILREESSGFDRFKKNFGILCEAISNIKEDIVPVNDVLDTDATANVKSETIKRQFSRADCDLRYILKHIDFLEKSRNRKSSDVLLHGLMDTATHLSANESRLNFTDIKELLRMIVKLKLLIHPKQVDGLREEKDDEAVAEEEKKEVVQEEVERAEENDDEVEEEEQVKKEEEEEEEEVKEEEESKPQLRRSNKTERVTGADAMKKKFETLSCSYNTLTRVQKDCLLCLSVFPCSEFRDKNTGVLKLTNIVIKKRILIQWWFGEGFTDPQNEAPAIANSTIDPQPTPNQIVSRETGVARNTIGGVGEKILKVLEEKGFIEPIMNKRRESGRCCIRPYVHSFVTAQAKKESFFDFRKNGKLSPDFTHSKRACLLTSQRNFSSSYKLWGDYTNVPEQLKKFKQVRTLFNVNESLIDIDVEWFSRMKDLSVLHLGSWCSGNRDTIVVVNQKFLKEMNKMKQLRLLSLQGLSSIKKLSDSVSNLTNLRILDLRGCGHLKKLPVDIGSLKNLTHLDITHCRLLADLPKGIGLLSKLEVLKGFRITGQGGTRQKKKICTLDDLLTLGSLSKLSLFVEKEEALRNHEDLQVLKKMRNLLCLKITWESSFMIDDDGNQSGQEQQDDTEQEVVTGCIWLKHNCWGRQLGQNNSAETSSNLRKLVLCGLPDRIASHLLRPRELEKLEELHVIAGNIKMLHGGTNDSDKWNVKTLRLKNLPNLSIGWVEFRSMFPHMTYLEMLECKKLALFPCDGGGLWRIRP